MKVILSHLGMMALLALPLPALAAQEADESALDALDAAVPPPVVLQEPPGAAELRDAMRRIAQRPSDTVALTDAGYAAIKLGDYDAAFNFFSKANRLKPSDARITAGLGIAQVRRENPFEALSLFDEAVRLGGNERSFAMDRALAFDLLGNFERAEKDYALAKSWGESDELTLRHAISASLAGKADAADRMLIPMLQKENAEAWRARALMLASRGDHKEASKIAAGFLEEREVRRMDGFFRNMPKLTIAQQAAAMHFGHFPVGSNIGSDSDQLVTLAAATGVKPVAQGDARLIPAGEPLGAKIATVKAEKPKKRAGKDKKAKEPVDGLTTISAQKAVEAASGTKVATLSVAQLPVPESARPPVRILLPALRPANDAVAQLPPIGPAVPVSGSLPDAAIVAVKKADIAEAVPADLPVKQADAAVLPVGPGFDSVIDPAPFKVVEVKGPAADTALPPQDAIAPPVSLPPTAAAAAADESSFDLGAIVNSIEVPDEEKRPSVEPVDLSKIKAVAAKPESVPAKADAITKTAKAAANTPRIYVQIATGADASGLGFDYRRMEKKFAALFAKQEGWTAAWGKTRRLLVGPFADMKAAKKWEADFRKAGGDGFVWQSDSKSDVEKLKGK